MNSVTAIDIAKPAAGKRLKKHAGVASQNYPLPEECAVSTGYTLEESYNRGLEKLSNHYGIDFRKL